MADMAKKKLWEGVKKEMLFENDAYDGGERKQVMIESYTEVKFFYLSIKGAYLRSFL